MLRKTRVTSTNDINPEIIFLLLFEEVYQFLQKVISDMALQILRKKSQFLALQFLLLFIQVIFLYLFHILQHTECSCFILIFGWTCGKTWEWDGVVPCEGIRIPESEKVLLMESWIVGFGIRNTVQGIRNPTKDWNPEFKFYGQILESSTWNPEDRPGFSYMGRMVTAMEKKMVNSFAGQWARYEELYVT